MSATEVHSAGPDAAVGKVDMHLEVEIIPVSDVDRSKEFYQRLGWRLDDDVAPLDGLRTTWWRSRPGRTCPRDRFQDRPKVSQVQRPGQRGHRNGSSVSDGCP